MYRSSLCFGVSILSFVCLPALAYTAPRPSIAWTAQLHAPIYTTPQAFGDQLYLTSTQTDGPNVFALNARTGKLLWSFATQGSIAISPTVSDHQLFIASDVGSTHFMRALNTKTGTLIWDYTRAQPPECMCSYQSTLTGGLLFAQTDGHSLYALQTQGYNAPSRRVWSFAGDGALLTPPVSAADIIVVGSSDRNLYGLDAKTGKILWQQTTGYAFTATPVIADGVVVVGDQGGNIDGFAVKTGKPLWSVAANGAIDQNAVIAGNTGFVVSEDRNIYALNITTGHVNWQYTMDDFAAFAPVLAGGELVVDNRAGQLLALTPQTGKPLWHSNLHATPFSAPLAWDTHQAVVLKLGDHQIAAFQLTTGKRLWAYQSPSVVTQPVFAAGKIDIATSTGRVLALK